MSKGMVKKNRPPRKQRNSDGLADLGLFNIPDLDLVDNEDDDSEVDESALESELEALLSGKAPSRPARPKPKARAEVDIDQLAAACMVDPDEGDDEDDSNLELDEDLLKELHSIAGTTSPSDPHVESSNFEAFDSIPEPPTRNSSQDKPESILVVLQDRLNLYNEALKFAKSSNDNSKIRRYGRAIKTLESLLKTAKAGGAVNEEDIPPVVNVPKKEVPPSIPPRKPTQDIPPESIPKNSAADINHISEPQIVVPDVPDPSTYEGLMNRRNEYRKAAVNAKKAGNKEIALTYMKTAKTFDSVIEAIKNGQPVDLSNIPPPPSEYIDSTCMPPKEQMKVDDEKQKSSTPSAIEAAALSAANEPEDPKMFDAPPPPTSILDALQQRLEKYAGTKQAAENEGNKGKVRRLDRIIKLYETAIKNYKAGKPVDFEELPTPPGFAPIPLNSNDTKSDPAPQSKEKILPPKPAVVPPAAANPKTKLPDTSEKAVPARKPKVQRTNTSTVDKQLEFLLERQKMFRQAAVEAKKNGDIQQAKEYLRKSKGFDSMIEATKCGLPIDASTIPTPPQLESDFVIVEVSECVEATEGSDLEVLEMLEKDLLKQIEMCSKNKQHFLRYGDVSSASKFERSGLESRKDLSVVQHKKKTEGPVPKFHYETRLFSIVNFNDLADNDLKVTIERGINLPDRSDNSSNYCRRNSCFSCGKPDLDSYVRIEFPIPSEAVQKAKTQVIRGTNNPSFQEDFTFEFSRKSKAQLRLFKRHALKCEVFSKGGFLRSDNLLGTVNVKLVDLEAKCTIHDSFSLMDGRKACGGKLEVKIQIREPLLGKQVEEVSEKWLVIGR